MLVKFILPSSIQSARLFSHIIRNMYITRIKKNLPIFRVNRKSYNADRTKIGKVMDRERAQL